MMIKIFIFGEKYDINKSIRLKPDKTEKIFIWLVPQNLTVVKIFLYMIYSTYYWVLDIFQLIFPLIYLTEKIR